jgi:phosphoribosylformimino-5-aminoimidazole carboxamide ribotide isomerase
VELYPAVDVQGGRVVRLAQGDAARATAYADDPLAVAAQHAAAGARWIHFVDLDRALGGGDNRDLARRVLAGATLRVQVGGGLRTEEAIDEMLTWGATRVVIGTTAATDPALVERLLARHGPERLAIGIDAKDGKIAVRVRTAGLAGAIVGRALYEGRFTLAEALACTA